MTATSTPPLPPPSAPPCAEDAGPSPQPAPASLSSLAIDPTPLATSALTLAPRPRSRAGRRPGAVWEFFTAVRTDTNKTHATCNYCGRRCAGVAARMIVHILRKCPTAPASAVETLTIAAAHEPTLAPTPARTDKRRRVATPTTASTLERAGNEAKLPTASSTTASTPPPPPPVARAPELTSLVHQKLVIACICRNLPFDVVADEFFHDALALLRVGYPRLTAAAASTTVLAEVRAGVASDQFQWLHGSKTVTLIGCPTQRLTASSTPEWSDNSLMQWRAVDDHHRRLLLAEVKFAAGSNDNSNRADHSEVAAWECLKGIPQLGWISPETIVGICTSSEALYQGLRRRRRYEAPTRDRDEEMKDRNEQDTSYDPNIAVLMLTRCLVHASLRMWHQLTTMIPELPEAFNMAASIVNAAMSRGDPAVVPPAIGLLSEFSGDCSWSMPFKLVKRIVALQHPIKAALEHDSLASNDNGGPDQSIWATLTSVDAIITPFAWLFALSESKELTSSVVMVVWLWLLGHLETSPLLADAPVSRRAAVMAAMLESITSTVEDHHVVALLLDPRTRGAGLSSTGRRKAKALVAHVGARVLMDRSDPNAGAAATGDLETIPRMGPLLEQLGHFLGRTGVFADVVVWEMSRGTPPESFWRDYVDDTPELASVALAVLTMTPHTHSLGELIDLRPNNSPTGQSPFDRRQIKYHHEMNHRSRADDLFSVVQRHAEILLPHGVTLAEPSGRQPTTDTSEALGPAVLARLSMFAHVTAEPTSTLVEEAGEASNIIDGAWFAVSTDADRQVIDAAIARLVPPSLGMAPHEQQPPPPPPIVDEPLMSV